MTTPAHLLARPLLTRIVRGADHVVTYGPHVSAFARTQGARRVTVAPQAVDNDFWSAPATAVPSPPGIADPESAWIAMFAGRAAREKGLEVLLTAWRGAELPADAALVLVGADAGAAPGVHPVGRQDQEAVRNFLAIADVLVIPSIPTRTFREPWGLIANEAMNQRLPIIASDSVGAAAGGLVRDGRNGLVVRSGDEGALGTALNTLRDDPRLRHELGENARRDVAAYTYDAWTAGFTAALSSVGRSRRHP